MIEDEVRRKVAALPGVAAVEVRSRFDPPWSVERISPAGREALRRHGVTVPEAAPDAEPGPPHCPFCDSAAVHLDSPFGPTRCRMIYYCDACRNSFEHLKRVGGAPPLIQLERKSVS
jgi:ring-1,2-phenylacetyl-CoA epoxidase subunit PaaD